MSKLCQVLLDLIDLVVVVFTFVFVFLCIRTLEWARGHGLSPKMTFCEENTLGSVLVGTHLWKLTAAACNTTNPVADSTSSTIRWDAIAHHLPGRTSRDVRKRWVNVLQNQFNKGAWTKDEDHRLRVAVQQYGTRWVSVAKDVDTRSADRECTLHLASASLHVSYGVQILMG